MPEPAVELKNVEWIKARGLSPETAEKGEDFILALINDGFTYDSMKGAFVRCAVLTRLKLERGVVAQTAERMGTDRNWIFQVVKRLGMRQELEAIRRQAEQRREAE